MLLFHIKLWRLAAIRNDTTEEFLGAQLPLVFGFTFSRMWHFSLCSKMACWPYRSTPQNDEGEKEDMYSSVKNISLLWHGSPLVVRDGRIRNRGQETVCCRNEHAVNLLYLCSLSSSKKSIRKMQKYIERFKLLITRN